MTEYAYCPHCDDGVGFDTLELTAQTELDGVIYSYPKTGRMQNMWELC